MHTRIASLLVLVGLIVLASCQSDVSVVVNHAGGASGSGGSGGVGGDGGTAGTGGDGTGGTAGEGGDGGTGGTAGAGGGGGTGGTTGEGGGGGTPGTAGAGGGGGTGGTAGVGGAGGMGGDGGAGGSGGRESCEYPPHAQELQLGAVMPPLSWPAKWPDGTDFEFRLEDVACAPAWEETNTVAFVLIAAWSVPDTVYVRQLAEDAAELRALGMQIVVIELQDVTFEPAGLESAYGHVRGITTTVPGIVAGDADTRPEAGFLVSSGFVSQFPTVFVVRTRDMRIVAKSGDRHLPLDEIAADPDADWSN